MDLSSDFREYIQQLYKVDMMYLVSTGGTFIEGASSRSPFSSRNCMYDAATMSCIKQRRVYNTRPTTHSKAPATIAQTVIVGTW